jgi:L-fuconolactonase
MKSPFNSRMHSSSAYHRRAFLQSVATAATAALTHCAIAADKSKPTIIDTHVHFYDPTRPEGIPWPKKTDKDIYRPMLPADFEKVAGPAEVTGVVVVEASPWLEDNQWLLDLAEKSPLIVGVVGNLTPGAENFADHLQRFAKSPLFRGIRINSSMLKDNLDRPEFLRDVAQLADLDLALDVLGGSEMLPLVAKLAKSLPHLRIVIDHAANPVIDGRPVPPDWLMGIRASAAHPQVFCKVSALAEAASRNRPQAPLELDHYRPVLDALWQAFGTERLMYGSNWPLSDRVAPYAKVLQMVRMYVDALGGDASERFFATNSQTAYKWRERGL